MTRVIALTLALVAGACGGERRATPPTEGAAGAGRAAADPRLDAPLPADAARVEGPNFHILAAPLACPPTGPCTVAADLHAENGFKVNPDYPHKLVEPSVALTAPASFATRSTTRGRLLLSFDRATPGPTTVRGTFKLSVCSADVCQIEAAALAVVVP